MSIPEEKAWRKGLNWLTLDKKRFVVSTIILSILLILGLILLELELEKRPPIKIYSENLSTGQF